MTRRSLPLFVMIALTLCVGLVAKAGPVSASAASRIVLDPNWGFYDTQVWIHGIGFSAGAKVLIEWKDLPNWQLFVFTNTFGNFDVLFDVPDGAIAGNHIVTATDEYGNTASSVFTLYYVYAEGGRVRIKTPKQYAEWWYDNDEFYHGSWKFYHDSYDGWYQLMYQDKSIYIFRFTYKGVTYIFDLAGGACNAWPEPLVEKVLGFQRIDINHVKGTILLYNPSGVVLLATVIVDIYTPVTAEDYYAMTFQITAEAELDDLAFYVAYNIDVYNPYPNWAYYENNLDLVYQYHGPNSYGNDIPERQKGYAGFASVIPASAYHDAVLYYHYVQYVASYLRDYNFNYRDRDVAYGDSSGDCGIGLQWTVGHMSISETTMIPVTFVVSDETLDAFKANVMKAKMFAYEFLSQHPAITLDMNEGPGSSVVSSSGEGFMPYARVNVYFNGVLVGSFIADRTGTFTGIFIVPTWVTGIYKVTAVDEYGLEASVDFEVVEPTAEWLLDKLNELNATITGLLKDMNGTLCVLINTKIGDVLVKLRDVNATITDLIVDTKGETLAMIYAAVGTLTAELDAINATIVSLIRDANGTLCAKIDTVVGTLITTRLNEIDMHITDLVTNAEGEILARINSKVGEVLTELDVIDARLVSMNGTIVTIATDLGTIQTDISNINGRITEIQGDVATIQTDINAIEINITAIKGRLTSIEGNIATIETDIGTIKVNVSNINANITSIKGRLVTIETTVGTIQEDVDDINGKIVVIEGDIATIQTDIGTIKVSLSDINTEITLSGDNIATILTDIGTIMGTVESIEGDIVTIKTDLGTITTTIDSIKYDTSLQRTNIALSLIAAISAIVAAIMILRKVYK